MQIPRKMLTLCINELVRKEQITCVECSIRNYAIIYLSTSFALCLKNNHHLRCDVFFSKRCNGNNTSLMLFQKLHWALYRKNIVKLEIEPVISSVFSSSSGCRCCSNRSQMILRFSLLYFLACKSFSESEREALPSHIFILICRELTTTS